MGVRDGTGALTGVAVTVTVDVVTGGSTPSPPPPHPVVAPAVISTAADTNTARRPGP